MNSTSLDYLGKWASISKTFSFTNRVDYDPVNKLQPISILPNHT
jgi:hypothetical protein